MKKIILVLCISAFFYGRAQEMSGHTVMGLLHTGTLDLHLLDQLLYNAHEAIPVRFSYEFTEINNSGLYQLVANVSTQIAINVSNVTLDLNGQVVSGGTNGIVVNSGLQNITIKNGTISAVSNDGIQVATACSNIIVQNVAINNALIGISCDTITDSIIENCTMSRTTTGIQLANCSNILMQECITQNSIQAGYDLLATITCSCIACNAFASGSGNAHSSGDQANVFGFVSYDGIGNSFDRCIANSTQNLNATDWDTHVAGFALLGTGTQGNAIIDCQASNAMSNPSGLTRPTGILLEARPRDLSALYNITYAVPGANARKSAWSPDGTYFVVCPSDTSCYIYQWDRETETALLVATQTLPSVGFEAAWSPDGQYIVIAQSGTNITILRFDGANNAVVVAQTITSASGTNQRSVRWHPTGRYFAVGTASSLVVYSFDRVQQTASSFVSVATGISDAYSVAWHSSGNYVAIGNGTAPQVNVYSFNETTPSLTSVASLTLNPVWAIAFSPEGDYLAVLWNGGGSNDELKLYTFNGSSLSLLATVAAGIGLPDYPELDWSPDSNYLALAGTTSGGETIALYSFNPSLGASAITEINTFDHGAALQGLRWSPDGGYLLLTGAGGINARVLAGLTYAAGNVICNNAVFCNSSGSAGVGISGSAIQNMIIQNYAFENPQNYVAVTNIFDQQFGQTSSLQNITQQSDKPITSPVNIPAQLKRVNLLLESLIDNVL